MLHCHRLVKQNYSQHYEAYARRRGHQALAEAGIVMLPD